MVLWTHASLTFKPHLDHSSVFVHFSHVPSIQTTLHGDIYSNRPHLCTACRQCSLILLLHPFNSLFSRTTWVSQYQKGKTSLDLNEARDDGGFLGGSGISWTTCKQSAPRSRQITTPTPHLNFYGLDALSDAQPMVSML